MADRNLNEEFMAADAEFSLACRAFNEAADRLHEATRKRSAAWNKLKDRIAETAVAPR